MAMQEQSFEHSGIPVHYYEGGRGQPLFLIHGSGPGASSIGNWRAVLDPLTERYNVFAMDLIGFGKSGRKPSSPYFDFALWLEQCRAMLARIVGRSSNPPGIIGHSISGALALKLAATDASIVKVMTTGTMGAVFAPVDETLRTWSFPKNREELKKAAEGLIHDRALIDEAYLSNREQVLFSGDYEQYFSEMFSGDRRRFIDQACLSAEELGRIKCDVLMVHGREDRAFPAETSLALARSLPQADVVLLGRCSHSVAFEYPQKFMSLARSFFG